MRLLPTVNASLNALSAALLLAGWIIDPAYRTATATSRLMARISGTVDLGSSVREGPHHLHGLRGRHLDAVPRLYLVYHYHAGSYPFPQGGLLRVVYLAILLSHTLLATASVPLIVMTVLRGWRGDLAGHTRFATITFPIWMYVASHRRRHLSDALPPAGAESDGRGDILTPVLLGDGGRQPAWLSYWNRRWEPGSHVSRVFLGTMSTACANRAESQFEIPESFSSGISNPESRIRI